MSDHESSTLAAIEHAHQATRDQAEGHARLLAVTSHGVAAIHGARSAGHHVVDALQGLLNETLESLESLRPPRRSTPDR